MRPLHNKRVPKEKGKMIKRKGKCFVSVPKSNLHIILHQNEEMGFIIMHRKIRETKGTPWVLCICCMGWDYEMTKLSLKDIKLS